MSSITNVWLPEDRKEELREAVRYYHFESMASFFRICGLALIDHHKRRDEITLPFQFTVITVDGENTPRTKKKVK
jgi:hypothetical protein